MATVTGLTADRMLAIEAESIVDGTVDVNGHLILTRHDGTTIDAGYIVDQTNVVNIVGVQTVAGAKTFTAPMVVKAPTTDSTPFTIQNQAGGVILDVYNDAGGRGVVEIKDAAGVAQVTANANGGTLTAKGNVTAQLGVAGGQVRVGNIGSGGVSGIEFGTSTEYMGLIAGGRVGLFINSVKVLDVQAGSFTFTTASFTITGTSPTTTLLYMNAASGHSVDLLDIDVAGVRKFDISATGRIRSTNTDFYFGPNALGGAGSGLHINSDTAATTLLETINSAADSAMVIRTKGIGELQLQSGAGNFFRASWNAGVPKLGFYGQAPQPKGVVTGSRGGNAALQSLLAQLNNIGIISDTTTA